MKKIFFAATMALALTCVSCYDDKGNYDYTDLEVVEVEKPGDNILEKYIISRFDTLTIDPKVTYQGKQVVGDEAPLDYLWTLYTTHPASSTRRLPAAVATTPCI